jgi:WD40 repeat protein
LTFKFIIIETKTNVFLCSGHEFPIWCIDENPNGCYAVTGSRDTTARLWSYERKFPLKIYPGHTQDVDVRLFSKKLLYVILDQIFNFSALHFIQTVIILQLALLTPRFVCGV